MHRTQIYLPENAYQELQALGLRRKMSLAELVRRAVEGYLSESRRGSRLEQLQRGFGLWQDREQFSTEEILREIRSEWSHRDVDPSGRH